jgi:serine/threonine protein kinase
MLSGGKLFDEGMYGCIFTPPLKCKEETKEGLVKDEHEIQLTKIILTSDAKQEFSIATKIRKIPLWKNYFVVSESMCEPAPVQTDKQLGNCPILKEHKISDFRILNMPFGGVPLSNYSFKIDDFDFMRFVIHFIEAGALLTLFGIVHRDIHQGNILIDNEQVPRIIDFNLAIIIGNSITNRVLQHQYNYVTAQEPPDSTLVNAISLGYNSEQVIDSIIEKKPILKKIRTILGVSESEMRNSFESFYVKSKSVKMGDSVKWFESYWRTIDSWAVGVNIVDLISKLSLWPNFTIKMRTSKTKLFPVLKRLCAVSPLERIDCIQALNYLNPNSFIIRKYGKSWLAKVGDGNIH